MANTKQTAADYYDTVKLYGNYRFISASDIIANFTVGYIGDGKIIKRAKKTDVAFYCYRAIQELTYDTLNNVKSQEFEMPPSLTIAMPHDSVNILNITWVDSAGVEHLVLPGLLSSAPRQVLQGSDYSFTTDSDGDVTYLNKSVTEQRYSDSYTDSSVAGTTSDQNIDFLEEGYGYNVDYGKRYGIDPVHATKNGHYILDEEQGTIGFTSDFTDRLVIVKYVSDGLASNDEMVVHKFAEEAIYKSILYGILSSRSNIPEYQVNRVKRERRASIRNAKLRLSKLNIRELTQIMRGKNKQIKN
tara:strand:+ start:283 stop:1185 length:903 start_codon:yes stop_codon:yes gene_type:complete